jgi:hypothetical protein
MSSSYVIPDSDSETEDASLSYTLAPSDTIQWFIRALEEANTEELIFRDRNSGQELKIALVHTSTPKTTPSASTTGPIANQGDEVEFLERPENAALHEVVPTKKMKRKAALEELAAKKRQKAAKAKLSDERVASSDDNATQSLQASFHPKRKGKRFQSQQKMAEVAREIAGSDVTKILGEMVQSMSNEQAGRKALEDRGSLSAVSLSQLPSTASSRDPFVVLYKSLLNVENQTNFNMLTERFMLSGLHDLYHSSPTNGAKVPRARGQGKAAQRKLYLFRQLKPDWEGDKAPERGDTQYKPTAEWIAWSAFTDRLKWAARWAIFARELGVGALALIPVGISNGWIQKDLSEADFLRLIQGIKEQNPEKIEIGVGLERSLKQWFPLPDRTTPPRLVDIEDESEEGFVVESSGEESA